MVENANETPQKSVEPVPGYCSTTSATGMCANVVSIPDSAPALSLKTWYGMPAYANQDGKIVCFFQAAQKFNARYATFGFNDVVNLDEGAMWPTSFALKALTPAEEAKIAALVKKAVN
jgi:hypothetical protein